MKKYFILCTLIVSMGILTACGSAPSPASEELAPTATLQPTEEPTSEPTEEVAEVVEEEEQVETCVNCHTNQELLMSLAKPEELVESENSGEG